RVELESPLFAPLSGLPCAYFQLEVRAPDLSLHRAVEEGRECRVEGGGESARGGGEGGRRGGAISADRGPGAGRHPPQGRRARRRAAARARGVLGPWPARSTSRCSRASRWSSVRCCSCAASAISASSA